MAIKKIIFFGTSDFAAASLKSLHQAGFSIELVVTQADQPKGRGQTLSSPPVKLEARSLNVKVVQPDTIKDQSFLSKIRSFNCDIIVVVAYGKILPAELLTIPPLGCINVHGSLLPRHRGAAPIQWAILHGDSETGVTTMQMNEKMDEGGIFLQEKLKLSGKETADEVSEKLSSIGADLLIKTVQLLSENKIKPIPQEQTRATYAPKIKKEDGFINWTKSADVIERMVRAFQPWPSAYCCFQQKMLKIWESESVHAAALTEFFPSQITEIAKEFILVKCGENSYLKITKLQKEGKNVTTVRNFLSGYQIKTGDSLK